VPYRDLLSRLASVRWLGVDLGLDRMRAALATLGNPQRAFPAAVQIAGTNGKGSTAAMTESILRAAGLRTGLYTSPHLSRFTERIRIDGREADGDWLAALDGQLAAVDVPLTYFEVATALAFLAFAASRVDVAVLETGLGGRLDAVTTAEPIATAITSIGFDHTAYLGDTLTAIAGEKAGILKPGVPCFLGSLPPEADTEITRVAHSVGAPLSRLGQDFPPLPGPLALPGAHQRGNAAIAVALARAAATRLGRPLDDLTIADGLARVTWPGRLERLSDDLLLDCAHNEEGARALAAALPAIAASRPIVLLTSIVNDKDPAAMFAALAPLATAVVTTRSPNTRAIPATDLATTAHRFHTDVTPLDDPAAALAEARHRATPEGLVVACGSIFLIGHLRAHLLGTPVDPEPTADPV
jgi:dihydrofolate synthase/folylpolyglutamate synthase